MEYQQASTSTSEIMDNCTSPEEIGSEWNDNDSYEQKLKRKLRFFFMNTIDKWKNKQRFPYKLLIQLFKILLVTLQLCLFAQNRYSHVNYVWDNKNAFSNLFLEDFEPSDEGENELFVYKKEAFFSKFDFAVKGYCNLHDAVGPYTYTKPDNEGQPLQMCLFQYKKAIVHGFNERFILNNEIDQNCTQITLTDKLCSKFSSAKLLKDTIHFPALLQATLSFGIKTVNLKSAGEFVLPNCYIFNVTIIFGNQDLDGKIDVKMDVATHAQECRGNTELMTNNMFNSAFKSLLNALVIIVSVASLILCVRALYRAQMLKTETIRYFKLAYKRDMSFQGKMEFINVWYAMIIVNDILIIVGSVLKEKIEHNQFKNEEWDICSSLLGIGNLLVWFGVLRYLGFFKTYNVVILTLKFAMPKVLRFMICVLIIYLGFLFCGWLVFGPYHVKFKSPSVTSECLFSLINGDDMFATFALLQADQPLIWWFLRIYLYSFISFYIYVVLALFITVIHEAHDTIKKYYACGFPKNDVKEFIDSCEGDEDFIILAESSSSLGDNCCCQTTQIAFGVLDFRLRMDKSLDSILEPPDII